MCAALRALLLSQGIGDALIFRKADGSAYTYMEANRAFQQALKLSGANPALTLHKIRHTVGS